MHTPLVTIITPAYNQERYIAECVESALAQTYPHWEQIVVDDGSTDRTREIVARYADPRIRVVALPHRGLAKLAESYNAALALSSGALVGILEGDDRWPPDKLVRQVAVFDDPGTMLVWGRGTLIDADGTVTGMFSAVRGARGTTRFSAGEAFRRLTRVNLFAPSISVMVRRRALDAIGGFRQDGSDLFVDLPTWLWLTATQEGTAVFADAVLGLYRVHPQQTSALKRAEMARAHWQVVQAVVTSLPPASRARLGWTPLLARRAQARSILAAGETALMVREHGTAARAFVRALVTAPGISDRLFALLGLLSAAIRVNLVPRAFALRDRLAR